MIPRAGDVPEGTASNEGAAPLLPSRSSQEEHGVLRRTRHHGDHAMIAEPARQQPAERDFVATPIFDMLLADAKLDWLEQLTCPCTADDVGWFQPGGEADTALE